MTKEMKRPISNITQDSIKPLLSNAVEFYTNKNREAHKCIQERDEYINYLESKLSSAKPQQALPVVPSFVAEWYEKYKANLDYYIYIFCKEFYEKTDCSGKELTKFENWFDIDSNQPIETLVRMKDGYTVEKPQIEKPQLFYIDLPKVFGLSDSTGDSTFVSKAEGGTISEFTKGKDYALKLTEQEIKSIDERYWQFAVPVEEEK